MMASDPSMRHVLVTGAAGYIGQRLAKRIVEGPEFADWRVTLADMGPLPFRPDKRIRVLQGDLTDVEYAVTMLERPADVVFHLAGILGGAAEANPALARHVNIDATLSLLERLRDQGHCPRVVFASTIGVFGPPLPALVDDLTLPRPLMTYGAQKLMIETALAQFSARGWLDGLAVRLPAIVAKREADPRLRSSFLNQIFWAYPDGHHLLMPVSRSGTIWMLSVPACIDALVHAALVDGSLIGQDRAITLPAIRVVLGELEERLRARFPDSRGKITFDPNPTLDAEFASLPVLATRSGDRLGFVHDGDIDRLIDRALSTQS